MSEGRLLKVFFRKIYLTARLRTRLGRSLEFLRYSLTRPKSNVRFHVTTTVRNVSAKIVKALDSVYNQEYERDLVRHVVINDDSTDDTHEVITSWMNEHPGNSVEYLRREKRRGGAINILDGFKMAEPGTVVVEVDGDDWLPDPGVFKFYNKVYASGEVWTTYNTFIFDYGGGRRMRCPTLKPLPKKAIRENRIRELSWRTSHLHTFRSELVTYIDSETQIDPDTGDYWETGWDKAQFLPMLELAGLHSRHIYRISYVYNVEGESESRDPAIAEERRARAERILKNVPVMQPLEKLVPVGK